MAQTNKAKELAKDNKRYNEPLPSRLRDIFDNADGINKVLGATRIKLAEYLGVSSQPVSNYCTGKTTPDADCLCKIAKFLNVSTDYLLGLETDSVKATQQMIAKNAQIEMLNKIIMFFQDLKAEIKQ